MSLPVVTNLVGAVAQLLHVIDCDKPLFGASACPECALLHRQGCSKTEPHEQRWCDGNPYDLALRNLRTAYKRTKADPLLSLLPPRRTVVADGSVGMRRGE